MEKQVKYLKRAKTKLLSSPVDLPQQISEMEIFLENFIKTRYPLYDKRRTCSARIRQLEQVLEDWRRSSSPEKSNQIADIISGLIQEIAANKQEFEKLEKSIGVLTQKEVELNESMEMLTRCKKTIELGVRVVGAYDGGLIKGDAVASLAGASVSSANSLMAECKNLLSEAS